MFAGGWKGGFGTCLVEYRGLCAGLFEGKKVVAVNGDRPRFFASTLNTVVCPLLFHLIENNLKAPKAFSLP